MTFKTGDAYSKTVFVGHDWTHAFYRGCGCMLKPIGSYLPKNPELTGKGLMKGLSKQRSYWQLRAAGRVRVSFLQRCGPEGATHTPVDGSIPMPV